MNYTQRKNRNNNTWKQSDNQHRRKNGTKSSFNVTATAEWNQLLCVVLWWLLWDKHVLVGQLRSKTFRGPLTAAARAISSPFTSAGWRVPTFIIVEESERSQWSREAHIWLMTVILRLRTCYSVQIWWGNMVATKNHKPALIISALKIHKFMRIYLFVGRHYPMYIYEYPIIIKLIQGTVSESRAMLTRLYNTYFTITLQFLLSTTNEP